MGRTPVPQSDQQLIPKWPYLKDFRKQNELFKSRQKLDFDRCHRTCDLPPIPASTKVWISSEGEEWESGFHHWHALSYLVKMPSGTIRRIADITLELANDRASTELQQDIEPSCETPRRVTRSLFRSSPQVDWPKKGRCSMT